MNAAIAADMQFITAIDADDAEVLDGRLGTIARAAADGDLEFMRHPAAPGGVLDLHAQPGGILSAEAAPFAAHAGFHRAHRLAIGMAGNHPRRVEIGPDGGQVFLVDAEQVDPLAACDLHRARAIFLRRVGNRA